MPSQLPDAIREHQLALFKDWMQLPAYEGVLEKLVNQAHEEGIRLNLWNQPGSRYDRVAVTVGHVGFIDVKREPHLGSRREVLYNIMHELGHHFDDEERPAPGVPNDAATTKRREQRAWDFADGLFDSFPELQADKPEYTAYRKLCSDTYEGDE